MNKSSFAVTMEMGNQAYFMLFLVILTVRRMDKSPLALILKLVLFGKIIYITMAAFKILPKIAKLIMIPFLTFSVNSEWCDQHLMFRLSK